MKYEWKNLETGEITTTEEYATPPSLDEAWRRVYSVHFLRVKGAGDSPGGYVRHIPKG